MRLTADVLPVARVCVDVPLAHLDRPFDYLVPADADAEAVPGCRVRVRFAGQQVGGLLLERVAESGHAGHLHHLTRVVSAEPVLTPSVAELARVIADRYAGTLTDVLRLAIPPRHARVEAEPAVPPPLPPPRPDVAGWRRYPRGAAFLDALSAGRAAHAVWQAMPGEDWPARLAEAAVTVAAAGRGVVIVVPDHRDVARVSAACTALAEGVVPLTADLGPAKRYRRFLAVLRGSARIVVGTRAAAFAPVADPGLLVVWDDGDDLHAEPRAPYPHTREVLVHRAHLTGAALLCAGFARTAEAQLLVDTGWAPEIVAGRRTVRAAAPLVTAIDDDARSLARDQAARAARLPLVAFDAARAALGSGAPVLVQVPRRGYLPALACATCRNRARCRRCAGPLAIPGRRSGSVSTRTATVSTGTASTGTASTGAASTGIASTGIASTGAASTGTASGRATSGGAASGGAALPSCRWCGAVEGVFACPACGSRRLRAVVVGAGRTAEELGRAFPGTRVVTSGGGGEVHGTVAAGPALVVATPGAEPLAENGYGAALLLDSWALLGRLDLRASEETLRRWLTAAALVRPAASGGRVVVVADAALAPVQALVRWDPAWHAATELAARTELGFPPAVRMAAVDGTPQAVADLLAAARLPEHADILGPVPLDDDTERALVRVPRTAGKTLAAALAAAQGVRVARKEPDPVRIQLDPSPLA
ncbi:MAG TPA: primosomal protein N' [Pseudonocardiaceae bacterium]|nr:primosomal protein N' [Pseudonocardiaceae bacterium]